jgi:hypothetical protein
MPTIEKPFEHFNAVTYTGTGTSGLAITGLGFKPDFVWIKLRSTSGWHQLQDSVRGSGYVLYSNTTDDEDNKVGTSQIQFDNDGFTLIGSSPANGDINTNGATYVAWCWRANGGTNVTNTDGTITSTVSANTSAGFSVVTYTGTGSNATVGHGLGVAPKMVIVKARNVGIQNWQVYHDSLGQNKAIQLDLTSAADTLTNYWYNGMTSTVFGINGSYSGINGNGNTYVAYCFSEVAGYSKFGSYTGNVSTDGPFIYTGFKPKFILGKSTGTNNWWIMDTARGTINVIGNYLSPDTSDAESTFDSMDILSNGFKLRSANAFVNGSGITYIYYAVAENPFKYSLAR